MSNGLALYLAKRLQKFISFVCTAKKKATFWKYRTHRTSWTTMGPTRRLNCLNKWLSVSLRKTVDSDFFFYIYTYLCKLHRWKRNSTSYEYKTAIRTKKVREKSRECYNHKPQAFPDTKRKPNKRNWNKRTKSTKISSVFPKRGNCNAKRTEKHENKITQGKT